MSPSRRAGADRSAAGRGRQGRGPAASEPATSTGRGRRPSGASRRPPGTNRSPGSKADRSRPLGGDRSRRPADTAAHDPDGERLQKVLAQAGVASRRRAEELIVAGRVTVDGRVADRLGTRVATDAVVHVDGLRVQRDESRSYLAVNKPVGMVSTMADEQGRPCLGDLVGAREDRLFHVGRLDVDSEGLLLLTNDGELAHRLQHPSHGVPKWYLAQVPGPVPREFGRRLTAGVELADGVVAVDSFAVVDSAPGRALVELVLHEGRKHVVRRLLAEVGHPVERLVRTRVGSVRLGELPPGRVRALSRGEVAGLYRDVGL